MTAAERLVAAWYMPRIVALTLLLWPLSLLFRGGVALRRFLYRAGVLRVERLPVPVIVIGNLNVGGAGKTPLALALVQRLAQRGFHPGVVSRGHGGSNRAPRAVRADDDPRVVGDESLLFAATGLPIWIGHERAAVARGLIAAQPTCDVIVADDGLQHHALARTMEIVVVDASRGFGNGLMLPAGPLREPAARLSEVDAVVRLVAGAAPRPAAASGRETLMTHEPLPWRHLQDASRVADPAAWRGREVHALCGTGNPQRFFDMVRTLGIVATEHAFPDHHVYTPADVAFPHAAAILMTHKDAVKCAGFANDRCWYLPLRAIMDPALVALVEEKIRGFEAA